MAAAHPSIAPPLPSFRERAGEACARALGVSVLASVPTALRTAAAGGGFLSGLLIGAGVVLPLVAFALVLSRAAGRGLRQLVGLAPSRGVELGIALWIGLALPLLGVLGAVLKATTHHRGLAGATFGVLGLAIVVLCAVLARTLVGFGRKLVAQGVKPWVPSVLGAALAALPVLVLSRPLGGGVADPGASSMRAAILDGAILLVATALVASTELPEALRRFARHGAVPLAVVLVFGAGLRLETSRPVAHAFKAGGGFAAVVLGVLEHWTDHDGDGVGSHFGGDDCDEGDPSRTYDCDRKDAVLALEAASEGGEALDTTPVLASATGARHPGLGGARARPDIVLVTLDTVRADHCSPYRYAKPTTPRLAELAARGAVFDHAYATGSDTQDAIAPLVSGLPLAETPHDRRPWPTLLPETDAVAERLKRGGYRTGAVTSFTWLSTERGFAQGFDYFRPVYAGMHPEKESTGGLAVKAALAIWKTLEADPHPIFLWIHLFDAHEKYLDHPGMNFGPGRMGAYDGEIAFVDKQLGELIDVIGGGARGGNVAWIVHGSQGEAFGEHDAVGHGTELYDESLRVPLVVAMPGVAPTRYGADAVSTLDLVPTVLDLAGLQATVGSPEAKGEYVSGLSLLPMVRGDVARRHGPVRARTQKKVAVIDWPLKLVVTERRRGERAQLFDLAADPAEQNDLSEARGEDVKRLSGKEALAAR